MRHISYITCLLAILSLAFSCQTDKRKQEQPNFEPEHISAKKFNEFFQSHAWELKEKYNVYMGDSLHEAEPFVWYITNPDGSLRELNPNESTDILFIHVDEDKLYQYYYFGEGVYKNAGSYYYHEPTCSFFMKFSYKQQGLFKNPEYYTVLTINSYEMHCIGPVYNPDKARDALFGYYIFKTISEEQVRSTMAKEEETMKRIKEQ